MKQGIFTIASLKGGVGKTTLTAYLSQAFASRGMRVLAVDLDANNNLTDALLREVDVDEIEQNNIYHVLSGQKDIREVIYESDHGFDVIPATIGLYQIGTQMARNPSTLLSFGPKLQQLEYDVVLLDTPPAPVYELSVGLYAAQTVITPVAPLRWIAQGLALLQEEIRQVEEARGRAPSFLAVPSMVTERDQMKLELLGIPTLSSSRITRSSAVRNAAEAGRMLPEKSNSFQEFFELSKEIL